MRKIIFKITVVLIGLVIGLVIAEIALRLFYPPYQERTVYVRNKEGLRDVDHALAKPPGTLRIAFQGDSFTFGSGIDFPLIFPTRVGDILSKKIPDKKIEVFNFGIPAANIFADLDNIRTKVLKYDPDVIVFSFVLNDFSEATQDWAFLKSFHAEVDRFKVFRGFEKYSRLASVLDSLLARYFSAAGRIHLRWLRDSFEPSVNPKYAEMIRDLEEIIKIISRREGVVVFFPYLVAREEGHLDFYKRALHLVKSVCDAHGCPFIEVLPLLQSKPYYRWWVSADNHHPNAAEHALVAAAISEKILENLR
jgi:hypothetical protein